MSLQKSLEFLKSLRVPEGFSRYGTLGTWRGELRPPAKGSCTFSLRGTLRKGTLRTATGNEAQNGLKFLRVPYLHFLQRLLAAGPA